MTRLITIPISHYCEKARWALERAGIPYSEEAHLQGFHYLAVWRAGGRRTVPILVTDEATYYDSTDILRFADARASPDRRLFPGDDAGREVERLTRAFDGSLGPAGRLWMYDALLPHRKCVLDYASAKVPRWQARTLPTLLPIIALGLRKLLGVTNDSVAQAFAEVTATYERVSERLSDGRRYLVGTSFSAADLTFAALSAPLVLPREYGVPLPRLDEIPEAMAERVRAFRAMPAGRFVMRMYAEERPKP